MGVGRILVDEQDISEKKKQRNKKNICPIVIYRHTKYELNLLNGLENVSS